MAPLHLATRNGHTAVVQSLLDAKVVPASDPNLSGLTLRLLISKAEPRQKNSDGHSVIYIARRQRKDAVASLLIAAGVPDEIIETEKTDDEDEDEEREEDNEADGASKDPEDDEEEEENLFVVAGGDKERVGYFSSLWNGGDGW